MNRFFRRVYKHLDPKCKNLALTYSRYALKQVMGFCKPLQALALAIVVFLVVRLYNPALTYSRYALKQVMGFCKPLQA